jgi:hypothetical protein
VDRTPPAESALCGLGRRRQRQVGPPRQARAPSRSRDSRRSAPDLRVVRVVRVVRAVTQTTHDTRHNTNHVCRVSCVVCVWCADLERARQECSNFGWSAPGADYVRLSEQLPRAFKSAGYDAGISFPSSSSLLSCGWLVTNRQSRLTMWLPCNRLHPNGDRPHAIGHDADQSSLPWLPQST